MKKVEAIALREVKSQRSKFKSVKPIIWLDI